MKKIVYVIIGLMAFVFIVNLSAVSDKNSSITLDSDGESVIINPLY